MEPTLEKGRFESTILLREIRIGRKNFSDKLVLEPSQLNTAKELILSAMKIENFDLLPKRLYSDPFSIVFDSNREMDLILPGRNREVIHFEFDDGDDLIDLFELSFSKWRDLGQMERSRTEDFPSSEGAEFSPPS